MNKIMKSLAFTAIAAVAFNVASAQTTVNPDGTGFVAKGDVQTALGYNNKMLQDNADKLVFTLDLVEKTETTWTCSKIVPGNDKEVEQERSNSTSRTVFGVLSSVARERNQVTGFILKGFEGAGTRISSEKDGPAPLSCPNANSGFTLDEESVQTISTSTGGLMVNGVVIPGAIIL